MVGSRRVNLLVGMAAAFAGVQAAHGAGLVYWDNDPATGGVQGGTGTWNTTNSNWVSAGVNGQWSSAGSNTAVFGVSPGIVQVNAVLSAGALQFDLGGYSITPVSSPKTLTLSTGAI